MSENAKTEEQAAPQAKKLPPLPFDATKKANYGRRTLRALGRKKRAWKLQHDLEFRKAYFEGRSKRSNDKKVAFRKGSGAKAA